MHVNNQNDDCNVNILHDGYFLELTLGQFIFSLLFFNFGYELKDNTYNNIDCQHNKRSTNLHSLLLSINDCPRLAILFVIILSAWNISKLLKKYSIYVLIIFSNLLQTVAMNKTSCIILSCFIIISICFTYIGRTNDIGVLLFFKNISLSFEKDDTNDS